MAYTVTAWNNGDLITADLLNHAEAGINAASSAVDELKKATATATALAAGKAPTVTFDGSSFAFGIPAGAQGAQGTKGDKGDKGDAGTRGSSIRVTATDPGATTGFLSGDVTINRSTWHFFTFDGDAWQDQGVIQGAAGADGADGKNGTNGKDGAAGKQGASFRLSAAALADNKADIAADALSPTNAALPYAVGDTVLDATTKKLYAITAVKSGVATIGTAIATLP